MTSLNLSADEVLSSTCSVRKRLDFEKPGPWVDSHDLAPTAIAVQVDLRVAVRGSRIGVRSWPSCQRVPPFFIWTRLANDLTRPSGLTS